MAKPKFSKKEIQEIIYAYVTGETNPLHDTLPKVDLECCSIHENGFVEVYDPNPIINAIISNAKALKECDSFALRLAIYRLVECLVDKYSKKEDDKK